MGLEYDPESGALYISVREGEVAERLNLAETGFTAFMDVDGEGNVLGVEFPSLKEYTELVTHSDGVLELADKIEDPADLSLPARG
jgi:uncharacterized protein YuzE